ncbi:MAG: hypothetical protein ACXADY_01665 [Candidatus Hodarchaeales archaeon]|jgi:hypothetical protein
MATNVTKLSRLSRNKTTGNVIIFLLIFIGVASFLSAIETELSSNVDNFVVVGGFVLSILFSYIVNKKLRRPFFIEISRYLEELVNRRFDVQQAAVQIELIDPLHSLVALETVLKQIDDLRVEMEEIINLTSNEISMNSPPIRTAHIRWELKEIVKLVEQSLEEIKRKRNDIVFLAKLRQNTLSTINLKLSRPQNEIEFDYLLFKIRKYVPDQNVDDQLFQQIIEHVLSQGEIVGRLERNGVGELVLAVESSYQGEIINDFSWDESEQFKKHCVICRHPIRSNTDNVSCPVCKNTFHRNHLLEWLKIFNQCPMCQERLTLFSNPS